MRDFVTADREARSRGVTPIYAGHSVGHAWYADPLAQTLEVFALPDGRWVIAATFSEAAPVTAPPFEAHTFPLDALWPLDAIAVD